MNNEWGISAYPVIPGHEVIGKVVALGSAAKGLAIGQRVGLGWGAGSCMHCEQCQGGDGNLCAQNVPTIVGHYGGFADRVRAQWPWAVPIPEGLRAANAGPLLCGGVTVFAPLKAFGIRPTDRVGVVGIGGLGHLALKFANAWGCEVTAFTSTDSKSGEARGFGAHRVVNSRNPDEIKAARIEFRPDRKGKVNVTFSKIVPGSEITLSVHPGVFFDDLAQLLFAEAGLMTGEREKEEGVGLYRTTRW